MTALMSLTLNQSLINPIVSDKNHGSYNENIIG